MRSQCCKHVATAVEHKAPLWHSRSAFHDVMAGVGDAHCRAQDESSDRCNGGCAAAACWQAIPCCCAGIMTILKTDENPGLQVFYQGARTLTLLMILTANASTVCNT